MTSYFWREGIHPPKGVTAVQMMERLRDLPEPSPEESYEKSKDPDDLLHEATWAEGDQVWATQARIEAHRRWITGVGEVVVVGGKDIEIRSVEFVRTNGSGKWAQIDDIRNDRELMWGYNRSVTLLLQQAQAKKAKFDELLKDFLDKHPD